MNKLRKNQKFLSPEGIGSPANAGGAHRAGCVLDISYWIIGIYLGQLEIRSIRN